MGARDILGDVRLPQQWLEKQVGNSVVEAQKWRINDRGNIVLMADDTSISGNALCR